ncbi:MAG: restriction endonuclease subunit S, partial [Bacteroidales bacterium]|nr:restriction endonuclease subunit S [Bacteroidales bacterium]
MKAITRQKSHGEKRGKKILKRRISSMRPSGVEWIGDIPAEWKISRIKYNCDVVMGQSPESSEVNDINGKYQFMQGNAEFTDLYPAPVLFCDKPNKKSRTGDVLMSVRAPVGEMNISDKIYGIGRGLCSIKPLRLFSKYFWYFMLKSKDDFDYYANGSTFDAITITNLLNFPIVLPPPQEQQAIAAFLDAQCGRIDSVITEMEQQIELLKQYKTSLITETVTKGLNKAVPMKDSGIDWIGKIPAHWEVKKIKYILESNQNMLMETTKDDYSFRYIDISSVDFDKGIIKYEEINFENAPSRARRIVKKGDTIVSTVRTYLKAIARIEDDKDVIVSTGFAVLSPKNNDPVFIEYYCKSDTFCSEIEKFSYGIVYPAISESILINIKIILPPLV